MKKITIYGVYVTDYDTEGRFISHELDRAYTNLPDAGKYAKKLQNRNPPDDYGFTEVHVEPIELYTMEVIPHGEDGGADTD